ncbi:MAG: outer membrane lipoprotein carrier protein LolA [Candidatus Syntrophosphaera sp.]|jgi:outer membrane lipoprotein-sorting protein
MNKCLLILAGILIAGMLCAATDTSALYTRLQATYGELETFQAGLIQTNYYPQLKKTITYKGKIHFMPGRMLMSFTEPGVQRLKVEDGRVELYDASSNTLFITDVQPEFGRMNPVEILQLYWSKSSVTVSSEDKTTASVKLVPAKDDLVNILSATLNKGSGIISELSYTDKSGNKVTYNFSAIRLDEEIPSSVWDYDYPDDVQVVEQ